QKCCKGSTKHVSSFREGNESKADGRSSDSGLPLAPPSRLAARGSRAESVSPYSGGTVPDLHRLPFPLALCVAGGYQAAVKGSPNASRGACSTAVRGDSRDTPRR